jgi:organic hydroperoxide reductase OsmC/OhrA
MISYPVSFYASCESPDGIAEPWDIEASTYRASCAVPREFEGGGSAFSPEDFYLLALQNCFVATFKVFAQYSRLNFSKLVANARLVVDKDESGRPCMKAVVIDVTLEAPSDAKKAQLIFNKTLENGFILRSVKTEISATLNLV